MTFQIFHWEPCKIDLLKSHVIKWNSVIFENTTPLAVMCDMPLWLWVNSIYDINFISTLAKPDCFLSVVWDSSMCGFLIPHVSLLHVWTPPQTNDSQEFWSNTRLCPNSLMVLTHSADGGVSNQLSGPVYCRRCDKRGWMQTDGLTGQSSSLSLCQNKTFK